MSSTYWPSLAYQYILDKGLADPYFKYQDKFWRMCNSYPLLPNDISSGVNYSAINYVRNTSSQTYKTSFVFKTPCTHIFKLKPWVCDDYLSELFARFRSNNVGLGNRYPTPNGYYSKYCELCDNNQRFVNSEVLK